MRPNSVPRGILIHPAVGHNRHGPKIGDVPPFGPARVVQWSNHLGAMCIERDVRGSRGLAFGVQSESRSGKPRPSTKELLPAALREAQRAGI